jgi:hypothetical protein
MSPIRGFVCVYFEKAAFKLGKDTPDVGRVMAQLVGAELDSGV